MLIRLVLAALVVAGVGVLTGTIDPSKVADRIPRPGHEDHTAAYLGTVEGDFARLQPLSGQFFSRCGPNPAVAGECYTLSRQVTSALQSLQVDLKGLSVPDALKPANNTLELAVARGIRGFAEVDRGIRTHRKAVWLLARKTLRQSDALMLRALQQLPATVPAQNWSY
jgi:hypothetical protein